MPESVSALGELRFRRISNVTAYEVVNWRYAPPYDRWNLSPSDVPRLLNASGGHFVALDGRGSVVGAGCAGSDARVGGGSYEMGEPRVVDFVLRMRPSLLGRGLGSALIEAGCDWLATDRSPRFLRCTLGDDEVAALRVLQRLQFVETWRFSRIEKWSMRERSYVQVERSIKPN